MEEKHTSHSTYKVSYRQAKELYRKIVSLCFPHYHGWITVARFMFFPYGDTPDVESVFALPALDEDVFGRDYTQSYLVSLSTVPDVEGMEPEYYQKQCRVLAAEFLRHHYNHPVEDTVSNTEQRKPTEGIVIPQGMVRVVRAILMGYIVVFAAWLFLRDDGTLFGDIILMCIGVFLPVLIVSLIVLFLGKHSRRQQLDA